MEETIALYEQLLNTPCYKIEEVGSEFVKTAFFHVGESKIELVAATDVIHQCAVEESMACGIGICMTCVLPVTNADGTTSMLRSCIDGPVMDGSSVRWDLVGKVPDSL